MPLIPSAPIYDVASLLPHSGHMVLIDCVKEFGDDYTVCRAPVGDKHILLQDGVLSSMAYMELMAQGIGAFAGIEALKAGEPVRLGFLLGTRKLDLFADSVPVGTELEVRAHVSIQDLGGMGVFDCELRWTNAPEDVKPLLPPDGLLAKASLNVYSPKDGQIILNRLQGRLKRQRFRRPVDIVRKRMSETILITGSNRGIGKAVALGLAQDGFDIVVHCRNRRDEAEAVAEEIRTLGRNARVLQFDVSNREACREILTADIEANGTYYGVVLNAGLTRDNAFPAFTDDDWDLVLRTNLDGFYNVLHPLTMPMIRRRKAGRIVCMASVSGLTGNRGQVNYSASKAGLIGAAKALAVELAKRKITVNCVAPGLIDTDIIDENVPVEEILKAVPAARMGLPEEVAHAVRFLMDEKAAYITRQVIAVNGGLC